MGSAERNTLLTLRDVSKAFGGVQALRGVTFDLRPGEIHALVGENGAGKSTLVRITTGADVADSGVIEINGRPIDRPDPILMRARGVAPIYQQPALFPDLTVAENLAVGLERGGAWRRIDWRGRRERGARLLARVGVKLDLDAPARALRMAEQQLVEIARALGAEARILLMDEPTAALSDREAERLFELIRDLRDRGVGIVYISHRLTEIQALADRVSVLRDGELIATHPAAGVSQAELIRLMVGREIRAVFPKRAVRIGNVVLDLTRLTCRGYGVHGVTLQVRAGEILGLAGLVGSGRTELARVLFGITPADGGAICLEGAPVRVDTPADAVHLGLAYVPEDRPHHGIIPELSVAANTTLACLRDITRWGLLDAHRERAIAVNYVERFAIRTSSIDAPVGTLSGGNQQKVVLARWLAVAPRVLILDEPTQGVDVGAKAEIHALIVGLAEQGLAILLISSELPEILGMSDRIAVMHAGGLSGILDRGAATQESILALALGQGFAGDTADPAAVTASAPADGGGWVGTHRREFAVATAYLALLLVLAVAAPSFYQLGNLRDQLVRMSPVLVAGVGMTLVILARQIDISIGSQFALCGVAAGLLAKAGLPMGLAGLAVIGVGALLGTLNGILVAGIGLPAIVVTLATMVGFREALRWATEGSWVQGVPDGFQWLGLGQDVGRLAIVVAAFVVWAAFRWGARHLAAGRAVYATGSNAEAARLAGMRPRRVAFGVFVAMGALTGLSALLSAIQFIDVQTNAGVGLELRVIAAVVVGGTAISGGRGSLVGTLLGVLFLGTAGPALTFLGSQAYWDRALQGLIILTAVAADAVGPGLKRRGRS